MANTLTLTSIAENIFRARDTVLRERAGFMRSVLSNSDTAQISINGLVNSIRTSAPTLITSYTPAMTIPATNDQTLAVETLTLDQVAGASIPLTGENTRKLSNVGLYQQAIDDMFAQAIRVQVNDIETKIGLAAYKGASRAYGTSGTTPFASDLSAINNIAKILTDNGTPEDGQRKLVYGSAAELNLRNLTQLTNVNQAGNDATLRRGVVGDLSGFNLDVSAGVASVTAGTGSGYLINNGAGYAVGDTALTVDTGTGTILAGDVVTIGAHKYVVATALAANVVTIARPGLRATVADNATVTVNAAFTANVGFHRNAIELAMRAPSQPLGGDAATDVMDIVDPVTGFVFQVSIYKGFGMNGIYLHTFYGVKVWKPEMVATLLG